MYSFKQFLFESHPSTRADRRREKDKPKNDIREKIKKIEKTVGTLSKAGQEELIKITDNFSKWPGEGRIKKLYHSRGPKEVEKSKIGDRRREQSAEKDRGSED